MYLTVVSSCDTKIVMAVKFYTTGEVAKAVGVSRQTLQTWIADAKITPPPLIGNTRVWNESQVADLRRIDHKGKGRKRKATKRVSK
jgi:excisionase family DNA binding protein